MREALLSKVFSARAQGGGKYSRSRLGQVNLGMNERPLMASFGELNSSARYNQRQLCMADSSIKAVLSMD